MSVQALQLIMNALPPETQQQFTDVVDKSVVERIGQVDPDMAKYLSQYQSKNYKVPGLEKPKPVKKRGMMSR